MIERIFRGWIAPDKADAYAHFLRTVFLPAAHAIPGYLGARALRRSVGGEVEFLIITRFESLNAIRAFAGEDVEKAHVAREARALLSRWEERVAHYEPAFEDSPDRPSSSRIDAVSRVIRASPQAIYRAFIEPDALMAWLPPAGMTGRVLEFDPQTGGRYRIELTYVETPAAGLAKTTEHTDITNGRFLELVPGRRIVQSVEFESDDPAFAGEMVMTWLLAAVPEGTRVTVTAENVPYGISKADHDAGLNSSLENLARFVE